MFSALDSDGDDAITFTEFYNGFTSNKIPSEIVSILDDKSKLSQADLDYLVKKTSFKSEEVMNWHTSFMVYRI